MALRGGAASSALFNGPTSLLSWPMMSALLGDGWENDGNPEMQTEREEPNAEHHAHRQDARAILEDGFQPAPRESQVNRRNSAGALSMAADNPQEGIPVRLPRRLAQRHCLLNELPVKKERAREEVEGSLSTKSTRSAKPNKMKGRGETQAFLHIYDLGTTKNANDRTITFGIGIFHVGIEVYGVEWAYGFENDPNAPPVSGIYAVEPRRCPIGTFRESFDLGVVRNHSAKDVWRMLGVMSESWLGFEYHPLKRNCVHFCAEMCHRLGVEELPDWVGRLAAAADVLLSPLLEALGVPNNLVDFPEGDDEEEEDAIECPSEDLARLSPLNSRSSGSSGIAPGGGGGDAGSPGSPSSPSVPPSRATMALTVALDFEVKWGWAFVTMLHTERQNKAEAKKEAQGATLAPGSPNEMLNGGRRSPDPEAADAAAVIEEASP